VASRTDILAADEDRLLAAVRRYDILDTPPDGAFDRITALAARLLRVPIATAHLLDDDDPRRRLLRLNPLNSLFIWIAGTELLTIRVDLDHA
jgi:hypothetical protein